jgi:DNA-binding transcriptional regulator YiaG
VFSMKVCECQKDHGDTVKRDALAIQQAYGVIKLIPNVDNLLFCSRCNNPHISKKEAKLIIGKVVEKKQKSLGFLTGREIRSLRDQMGMTVRDFGAFLKMDSGNLSSIENGHLIQSKPNDQLIRIRTEEYITRNSPQRKKLKKVFAHMIQTVGTSKLFLNKMMFYVDFWNFKKLGKSLTGGSYTPFQYGPCPVGYHEILKEMIADCEITAIEGHRFRVTKTPDMSEFSVEEMESINDIIKLARNDKGQKLFNLSHEEKGFIETPLYETISYEKYAKDLKIEELLNEIAGTG